MNDVDYADILLATMRQLEWQVRNSPLGLKLDGGRLDDLAMRLARVTIEKEDRDEVENTLETEFRVEPQIPFFAKMMAAVRGFITSGSTYKKQLRLEIQQRAVQFLDDLNDLIVLEYQNEKRWADVHPAVQEIRKFREAWENEKSKFEKKKTTKGSRKTKR